MTKVEAKLDINQLLPLLEILLGQQSDVKDLVNQWLKVVSAQRIEESGFIASMFHIFSASMGKSGKTAKTFQQVDIETINLLSEIRYQLLDDKHDSNREALSQSFFKCLLQSTDFWINQSLVKENMHLLSEQYWLLIKTIYSQDPELYNAVFPAKILITLMSELSEAYTSGSGHNQKCCSHHEQSCQLLAHHSMA